MNIYPQWFIEELFSEEDKQKALDGVLSSNAKVLFKCDKHIKYLQTVKSHICLSTGSKKRGCPLCSYDTKSLKIKSLHSYNRKFPEWFVNELAYSEDIIKARNNTLCSSDKVYFKCDKHGAYLQKVGHHIKLSTGERQRSCPLCSKEKATCASEEKRILDRKYPEWFIKDLVDIKDVNNALKGSLKTTEVVKFCCANNHVYNQRVSDHICLSTGKPRYGCLKCSYTESKEESYICDYLHKLGIDFIRNDRSVLEGKELDIYIPSKNIAIEYNGSYWHKTLPNDGIFKDKFYHFDKFRTCLDKGIHLISIYDVDFNDRKNVILNYIKDLITNTNTLYARKCTLSKVDYTTANKFYDDNHILGKTPIIDVTYGLLFNGELVSCMSFQKGRYKKDKSPIWCLSRFCTKQGYSVKGGASRLLKNFEDEYCPSIVVSYSDNDYFKGRIYSLLGFDDKGYCKTPRYYWNLDKKQIKREHCQLKVLSKKFPSLYKDSLDYKGNKEDYIMLSLGSYKVYRSGNKKWIKIY